jgi:hypothetical protein
MERDAVRRQFVVFANFRTKVEDFLTWLKAYLDLKGYTGDVITVVGTQYKEQKMHHAALFLRNNVPDTTLFHKMKISVTVSLFTGAFYANSNGTVTIFQK